MTTKSYMSSKLLRIVLCTLYFVLSTYTTWAGVPFEAVNRMIDNGDGTFTSTWNAGNQYALAIADLSEIAGISTKEVVKVEFDCTVPSGSRWMIGLGDKTTRGTNANSSNQTTYSPTGLMMYFGTDNGTTFKVFGGNTDNDAFNQSVHVTFTFDRTNPEAKKYSYSIVGENVDISATDATTISDLTIIELYTWMNGTTITVSDVKVFDGFHFKKGTDVMYIEDLIYESPLVNETGESVTYTLTNNNRNVRTEAGNAFPYYPIKTTGSEPSNLTEGTPLTITATSEASSKTTSMYLFLKTRNVITDADAALVSGVTFDVGSNIGLITDEDVNINGLLMHFGANATNNGSAYDGTVPKNEQQVIRSINGEYGVTCIDINGWTHGSIIDFSKGYEYWGTFYRLAVPNSEPKDIIVTAFFSGDATLRKDDGTEAYHIDYPGSGLATIRIPRSSLQANTPYYLYCPMGVLALKSLSYTDVLSTISYSETMNGVAFINEAISAPTLSITTTDGTDISSHYGASYSISNGTINSSTGAVTALPATEGKVTVTCTLTRNDDSSYPSSLSATFNIFVTDGNWNIENDASYSAMDNASTGLNDGQWSARGGSHVRNKLYTNTDFELIWDKSGDLFAPSYGLQIKGHTRFLANANSAPANASITMFATGDNAALRIPARKGMKLIIKAIASDNETELRIDGVTNLDGTTTNSFMSGTSSSTSVYLCNSDDGYVTLYNDNSSLSVNIQQISVVEEIILREGNDGASDVIYVEKGSTSYLNEILNDEGSTFTYAETEDVSNIASVNASTGEVSLADSYGTVKVTVTGTSGLLNGKSKTFTIQTVKMSLTHNDLYASLNNLSYSISDESTNSGVKDDLKQNVIVYTSAAEESASTNNTTVQAKSVFSLLHIYKPSTTIDNTYTLADVYKSGSNYVFVSDGLADVVIKAKLGNIEKNFTYHIRGVEFATMHPVIGNDVETYDLPITNNGGTIHSVVSNGIYPLVSVYGDLATPSVSVVDSKIRISNIVKKDGSANKGGAITVAALVDYTSVNGTRSNVVFTTVITVAYSENVWNFQPSGDLNLFGMPNGTSTYEMEDNDNSSIKYTALHARPLPDNESDYNVAHNSYWEYQKKFRSPDSNGGYVYAYRNLVDANNAPIIQETAGLQIFADGTMGVSSYAEYTENGFCSSGSTDEGTYYQYTDGINVYKYSKEDYKKELVFKSGCRIVIPHVKAGQQIDLYWHRHHDDQGERLRMKNLLDATGVEITDIYKIAYTGVGRNDMTESGSGSYSFIVKDTGEEWVDVEITSVDGNWTRIHEIVLHAPTSIKDDTQSTYVSTMLDMDNYHYVPNGAGYTVDVNKSLWSLNVHTHGHPTYTTKLDDTLKGDITWVNGHPVFNYTSGWGKFYIIISNTTEDAKYVSTWKSYTFTVGQPPAQTYPYTWDFTKFKMSTKTDIATSDAVTKYITLTVRDGNDRTITRDVKSWNISSDDYAVRTEEYNSDNYDSYFVDGGQLISSALQNGLLPETEGLGFTITDKTTGGLTLHMRSTVDNKSEAYNGETWSSGKLTLTGGGSIIVPKPGDSFADYYIYINSSVKPSSVTNAEDVSGAAGAYVTNTVTDGHGQFKYHFTANANAEITFNADVNVYAIGVTKTFKILENVGGSTGWATESRDVTIDYTLDNLLTTNPVKAYVIIEQGGNPVYSDDKSKTTVKIEDERFVVPANNGLVLKQTSSVPGTDGTQYSVPLFVPAVTTSTDAASLFTNNLMRPNVTANRHYLESVGFNGSTYVKFLLAKRYMTWKKEGATLTKPTAYESRNVASFYRWHIYTTEEAAAITGEVPQPTVASLNTLGANKAYLLLRADQIADPLWSGGAPAKPRYVGIEGESDMDDINDYTETKDNPRTNHTYNLNGQVVDDDVLPPGIYIKNGKKILVR